MRYDDTASQNFIINPKHNYIKILKFKWTVVALFCVKLTKLELRFPHFSSMKTNMEDSQLELVTNRVCPKFTLEGV